MKIIIIYERKGQNLVHKVIKDKKTNGEESLDKHYNRLT